jgi:hypothetical protein
LNLAIGGEEISLRRRRIHSDDSLAAAVVTGLCLILVAGQGCGVRETPLRLGRRAAYRFFL